MINRNRIIIDIDHPNSRNAEAFLNSWEEPFIKEENGANRFVYHSTVSKTQVELRFFDSWAEADAYGTKHYNPVSENRMWSLNGAMLFMVTGDDVFKVSSLIGHFAGRE
jgi:hypothetical protein